MGGHNMRGRFAHQAVLGILLICSLTVISRGNLEECTIGVASGKATADGRPLLWKNRDGSYGPREVVYFKDGRFKYLAVGPVYTSQWIGGGVNEFGFCTVNSAAVDLPEKSKKGMHGGHVMKTALRQCVTVDDFENILKQTNVSGRTTACNIGVIDAFGGAAIFETGNFSYTRFDATDPKVAPQGYIVRANFTLTGGGDRGRARYDRANQLWQQAVEKDQLDYRYVLRKVCRDLSGSEDVSYTPPEMEATENNTLQVLNNENAINHPTTTYVALFHGVRPDENPSLTTFWPIIGGPIFSIAVPSWVIAESTAPEMDGAEFSPLCIAARDLYLANYVTGDKRKFLLNPDMLPDIWAVTYPVEDHIFDQTESIMAQWRQDYPTARQVASFHRSMASEAMNTLQEVTELLMRKGGPTAHLRIALHMRSIEKAKAFIEGSININVSDGHGYTPLHYAVQNDHKEIVELLISKNADVNAKNRSGQTPLHIASDGGNKDIVELLLSKGADINATDHRGQSPLHQAVSNGHKDIVELLIAKGDDVSLHQAARFGTLSKVKSLIEEVADINAKDTSGQTPLHYAVEYGHEDVVKLLIANGADVNAKDKDGKAPGHVALWKNHSAILCLLIAKGANLASIHLSAYQGDLDQVRCFIEKGVDVYAMDSYGATSLHYAAGRGNKEVVDFLVARGADVNSEDKGNTTPLHRAALGGHKDVVELLIDNAANINARDQWNDAPMHYAVWSGITEVVELFVEKGAEVNAKDEWGWSPLHYMADRNYRDMAVFLIAKGADVNAEDNWGKTPLRVAKDKGHNEIVELLKKHGVKK